MIKQVLFSLVIVFGLMSCEEPVHEEYGMDGEIHDWSDDGDDGDASGGGDVYIPLAVGNWWDKTTSDGEIERSEITGTEIIEGKTYYKISDGTSMDGESEIYSYVRREGNTYITRSEIEIESGGVSMFSDPFFMNSMKDNVSVGDAWVDNVSIVFPPSEPNLVNFTYLIEEMYDTYDSNGTTYEDVAKLKITMLADGSDEEPDVMYSYYALNIGNIEASFGGETSYLVDYYVGSSDGGGDEEEEGDDDTCVAPSSLSLSEATGSAITLSWVAGGEETSWKMEYGLSGFSDGEGTSITVSTNSVNISEIDTSVVYDFHVKSLCSDTLESDWSSSISNEVASVEPNHALMTATIDGTYYGVMKPALYGFTNAVGIHVVSDKNYLRIQGNSNYSNPTADGVREINLFLYDAEWSVGTYDLVSSFGTEASYFNMVVLEPNIQAPEIGGTITVTRFDTTARVIEGTFEFEYTLYNVSTGEETGPFTATGTFDYSLDDSYFD